MSRRATSLSLASIYYFVDDSSASSFTFSYANCPLSCSRLVTSLAMSSVLIIICCCASCSSLYCYSLADNCALRPAITCSFWAMSDLCNWTKLSTSVWYLLLTYASSLWRSLLSCSAPETRASSSPLIPFVAFNFCWHSPNCAFAFSNCWLTLSYCCRRIS